MIKQFSKYIQKEKILEPNQRVLLAISGGIDSMVLCSLFEESGIKFSLAHCNFSLRGKESDGDEEFIRQYAAKRGLELFVEQFNTQDFADEQKMGIQEAAREIRYSWFRKLSKENDFDWIATAHHRDDQAETVLMNFIRGAGTQGLGGIHPKRKDLIRPLLFASKHEIIEYAERHEIPYRNDSSNESLKYRRNLIRQEVLPSLENINPGIKDSLNQMSILFRETNLLIQEKIKLEIQERCIREGSSNDVPIPWLEESAYPHLLLWDIISPLGFSSAQLDEVLDLTSSQSGRSVSNQKYTISRDRMYLKIVEKTGEEFKSYEINSLSDFKEIPNLSAEAIKHTEVNFSLGENVAYLDIDKLNYPIIWRPWQAGDSMKPLGMQGKQKISDILIQRKIPLNEKSACYVLESAGKIIWLAGIRFSEEFKITNAASSLIKIAYSVS